MRLIHFISLFVCGLLLSGCLSMMRSNLNETVKVHVKPAGTTYRLYVDGKEIKTGRTPDTLELRIASGYVFRFEKEGYLSVTAVVQGVPDRRKTSLSLLFGLFTMGIGYSLDKKAGAHYVLRPDALDFQLYKIEP